MALFCTAGFWQLDRAAGKRELFQAFSAGTAEAALPGLPADADSQGRRYRRLRLTGRYDAQHQVLLDNMTADGMPGYQVLTPLRTPAGNVLVNRGWVPSAGDRKSLPSVAVNPDEREVTGRIDFLPRPAIRLEVPPPPADTPWPRRLFFPTAAELGAQLGYPLRSYQVLLDPARAEGYRREWRPAEMTPEQHVGYAVQWFGLAVTALILYVTLTLRGSGRDGR